MYADAWPSVDVEALALSWEAGVQEVEYARREKASHTYLSNFGRGLETGEVTDWNPLPQPVALTDLED